MDDLDETTQRELFPAYESIQARLGDQLEVRARALSLHDIFSIAFVRLFLADCPNFRMPDGTYGATRSNWTYHTALAMGQAAKLLGWSCKFETLGKRDAILETRDEHPVTMVVAEWEWDSGDIFGKGKELDKLRVTCRDRPGAAALLLTYCTEAEYPGYLERIAAVWCGTARSRQKRARPALYLHCIICENQGSYRQFEAMRLAVLDKEGIELWCDEFFD